MPVRELAVGIDVKTTMSESESNNKPAAAKAVRKTTVLADVLEERSVLTEPEVLRTFREVLSDLEAAHGKGVLHSDISPARIVLDGRGWKLTEYGLATVGTVRYMSPERCQGKPVDARSDVYSLGAVLYQAATGKPPFDAEMKFQIMDAHIGMPPPSPREANPAISTELEQVILRALAKDPADRFQTAAEFRQAIEAVPGADLPTAKDLAAPEEPVLSAEALELEEPAGSTERSKRFKPAAVLVPLGAIVVVVAALLLTEVIGNRRVPPVAGLDRGRAEQLLRGKGFPIEADSIDDTLPAGTVVEQDPKAGLKWPRSRPVRLTVSTGKVGVPAVAGMALDDARSRLVTLGLVPAKLDTQYSDDYATGLVVSSKVKAGTRLDPRSPVPLTVSGGRATCPDCGARRELRARFCTKCGFKF